MSLFGFGLHVSDFTTIHAPPNLFIAENLDEEEEVVEENEEEDEEEDDDVDSETTTNLNLDLNLDLLLSTTTRQKRKKLTLSKATKEIFKIGWPTMLQNVSAAIASIFAIYLVAKHENTTAVAAYGLASSLCSVTGHCLLWGIGGALDTLSSQSFGAKKIARIGELWWRCVAVLICTCWFPAVCVWSRAELILTSCLHFPSDVSHLVEVYAMVYAPGLLAQCLSCACLKTLLACKKSETVAKISTHPRPKSRWTARIPMQVTKLRKVSQKIVMKSHSRMYRSILAPEVVLGALEVLNSFFQEELLLVFFCCFW